MLCVVFSGVHRSQPASRLPESAYDKKCLSNSRVDLPLKLSAGAAGDSGREPACARRGGSAKVPSLQRKSVGSGRTDAQRLPDCHRYAERLRGRGARHARGPGHRGGRRGACARLRGDGRLYPRHAHRGLPADAGGQEPPRDSLRARDGRLGARARGCGGGRGARRARLR